MAVAVKNTPESQTRSAASSLTLASVLGAVYVLGALALVFQGVPKLWEIGIHPWLGPRLGFLDTAGLIVVMVFAAVALCVFGLTLVGPNSPTGLKGGVFAVLAGLAVVGLATVWISGLLERWVFSPETATVGLILTALIAGGLLFGFWRLFTKYATPKRLEAFEDQGWFSVDRYKPNQGQRVRRATMLGLLLLLGAGVYVLITHGTLATAATTWSLRIPFTSNRIPLLPDVALTAPLLLGGLGFWFAYRVVNLPTFADFLIATEAEVNKVSWPTRKSVVQDTIVVLATVILMTIFLFVVDLSWGWILSRPVVGVLRMDDSKKPDANTKGRGADGRPQDEPAW